ncbi:anaerobic benzoate catabolism transcriptional regulator [Sphingomonas dokdonensis]|uniref:Anaerobic benzoate catabolism transcriptional regulator n=1 Tax=Sphingomonas dokdonensis TaxID=344880 RepID=A0A245ZV88_9SPHN|nr:anaerobic benzoate catabolism transcriptional regulator [Sphingomonas dokdonensis]
MRVDQGLSQASLADASGTSEEWVRKLERGVRAPSLATLDGISRALGVTIASLFAGTGEGAPRYEVLIAEAEGLGDDQLRWLESAARLARKLQKEA